MIMTKSFNVAITFRIFFVSTARLMGGIADVVGVMAHTGAFEGRVEAAGVMGAVRRTAP